MFYFCLTSVISLAGNPDEPIEVKVNTEYQLVFTAISDKSLQTTEEYSGIMIEPIEGCLGYAVKSGRAEILHYGGNHNDLMQAVNFYYKLCNASGGPDHMIAPVFL